MFKIGENCDIHPTAVINVLEGHLGAGSIVREGARIEGARVEIGREAFLDRYATIGGGSCFDPEAWLVAGDWLHMGVNSHINTARGVTIGHEFGCGIDTKVFTHGAYLDSYGLGAPVQWAPVSIGDNVWMPNAWVNPGVTIGPNVVIAARSLVNADLPAGCLAGGIPAKILKEGYLPRHLEDQARAALVAEIVTSALKRHGAAASWHHSGDELTCDDGGATTTFDLGRRIISGAVTSFSSVLRDQLRRNGIRFRYRAQDSAWRRWADDPQRY